MIDFNYDSFDIAAAICDRAEDMCFAPALEHRMGMIMDLMAANGANGNPPLDYPMMLRFKDGDFMHDVAGIYRHLNRETGKLEDCFLPRCAE